MCTIGKSNPRAQGVYLAQDFSRMGTARMKQDEKVDIRIIVMDYEI